MRAPCSGQLHSNCSGTLWQAAHDMLAPSLNIIFHDCPSWTCQTPPHLTFVSWFRITIHLLRRVPLIPARNRWKIIKILNREKNWQNKFMFFCGLCLSNSVKMWFKNGYLVIPVLELQIIYRVSLSLCWKDCIFFTRHMLRKMKNITKNILWCHDNTYRNVKGRVFFAYFNSWGQS